MSSFKALEVDRGESGYEVRLATRDESDLPDGDVVIDIKYSDLNYKDGLVMTGRFGLVNGFPRIAGIDLVGTVITSSADHLAPGQLVTVNGRGLGTDHDGGLAQRARVPHDWVTVVPETIDALSAAAIGTAGYTAALAVVALQKLGVKPESGPVLVTGAAGGAGSVAVMLLSTLGYQTVASTGRRDAQEESLRRLGASEVIDRINTDLEGPLSRARWAGAVDTVGSATLAAVIAEIRYGGSVAALGMAQGVDLMTSVIPFISRGVTLAGIDSVLAPNSSREEAWSLLAKHLDLEMLKEVTETIPLSDAHARSLDVLAGKVHGRIVVDVNA